MKVYDTLNKTQGINCKYIVANNDCKLFTILFRYTYSYIDVPLSSYIRKKKKHKCSSQGDDMVDQIDGGIVTTCIPQIQAKAGDGRTYISQN